MTHKTLGTLGLCLSLIGILTLGSSTARSEAGARWLILNSTNELKTGSELPASLSSELTEGVDFKTKILGDKTRLSCTAFKLIETGLEGSGSLTNGGKGRAEGCAVYLNEAAMPDPTCKPHSKA
jgi:hypothetical protein